MHKAKRLLIDEKDKKKYHIRSFPDQEFVKIFVPMMKMQNKATMIKGYKKLTNHVLKKMGGFNIDGWKIKSPA